MAGGWCCSLQELGQRLSSAASAANTSTAGGSIDGAAARAARAPREFATAYSQCLPDLLGEDRAGWVEQVLAAGLSDILVQVPPERLKLLVMSHGSSYLAAATDAADTTDERQLATGQPLNISVQLMSKGINQTYTSGTSLLHCLRCAVKGVAAVTRAWPL